MDPTDAVLVLLTEHRASTGPTLARAKRVKKALDALGLMDWRPILEALEFCDRDGKFYRTEAEEAFLEPEAQ